LKSTEKEKEQPVRDRDGMLSEKLQRENMKKGLRELLKTRLKEMTVEEQRKISGGSNTPELLAEKIEEELTRVHGGAGNPKCRAKYRSIYFNLKYALLEYFILFIPNIFKTLTNTTSQILH